MIEADYNVIARIAHNDGTIEERRVWLTGLTAEEAERQARLAVEFNPGVVIEAHAEKFASRLTCF